MRYRMLKFGSTAAYIAMIVLTWRWLHGNFDWQLSTGCLLVSGLWLGLTYTHLGHLLQTYFDVFSRLKVLLPTFMGLALTGIAAVAADGVILRVIALGSLAAWVYVYSIYRRNRKLYITQGHGPLPKDTWVNPDALALVPGDLILTSGRIATRMHESVGHGESVVRGANGSLIAFSSYMEKGAIINPVEEIASAKLKRGHFIVLRLVRPLTEDEIVMGWSLAQAMLRQNNEWRAAEQARRDRFIARLWLPSKVKNFVARKLRVTGYDWAGLFTGRRAPNRWTCIGAALEHYWRMGITTNQYGTGLLGFGTGLLDPIMPVRFLNDPAFRLLTVEDKKQFESQLGS